MTGKGPDQKRREHHGSADDAHPTADQLRADIDSGRAQDKVSHPDPAAAPLGTDAEASGNPPTAEEVDLARQREVAGRKSRAASDAQGSIEAGGGAQRWPLFALAAFVVVCVLVALAVW